MEHLFIEGQDSLLVMEGNIVKMKKKLIFSITTLLVIGLGILVGAYLYYNVPADIINGLCSTSVQ